MLPSENSKHVTNTVNKSPGIGSLDLGIVITVINIKKGDAFDASVKHVQNQLGKL